MEDDTKIGSILKDSLKELVNFLLQKCVNKKMVQSESITKFLQEVDDVCLDLLNHCHFPLDLYSAIKKRTRRDRFVISFIKKRTRRDRFVISCPLVEFECTSSECQEEATVKAVFTDPGENDGNIFYFCKGHYFVVHSVYSLLHMESNMMENIVNRVLRTHRIFCSTSVQLGDSEFQDDNFNINRNIINSLIDYYFKIFLSLGKPNQKRGYHVVLKEFLTKNDFFDIWKRPVKTPDYRPKSYTKRQGKRKKIGQITPKKNYMYTGFPPASRTRSANSLNSLSFPEAAYTYSRYLRLYGPDRTLEDKLTLLRLSELTVNDGFKLPYCHFSCAAIDHTENKFMVVGASDGDVYVIDLDQAENNSKNAVALYKKKPVTIDGHSKRVLCCEWFKNDASSFITSSRDSTVKLWDTANFEVLDTYPMEYEGHRVVEIDWNSIDPYLIAVSLNSSVVKFIDSAAGDTVQQIRWESKHIGCIRWYPNNRHFLFVGTKEGNAGFFDIRQSRKPFIELFDSKSSAFENKFMVVGASDGDVYVIDLDQAENNSKNAVALYKKKPVTIDGHSKRVLCCEWFKNDASSFITSSRDSTVKLWDTANFEVLDTYPMEYEGHGVVEIDWNSIDPYLIAVSLNSSVVKFIDSAAGDTVQQIRWESKHIGCIRWYPNNRHFLFVGTKEGNAGFFDIRQSRKPFIELFDSKSSAFGTIVQRARFTKDGTKVIVMGSDFCLKGFNMDTGEMILKERPGLGNKRPTSPLFDLCEESGKLFALIPCKRAIKMVELIANNKIDQVEDDFHMEIDVKNVLPPPKPLFQRPLDKLVDFEMKKDILLDGFLGNSMGAVYRPGKQHVVGYGTTESALIFTPKSDLKPITNRINPDQQQNLHADDWSSDEAVVQMFYDDELPSELFNETIAEMCEKLPTLSCCPSNFMALYEMTAGGEYSRPYENNITPFLLKFLDRFDEQEESSLELKVVEFATKYIEVNAPAIEKDELRRMVSFFCRRCIKGIRPSIRPCLGALNSVVNYSMMDNDILGIIVTTLSVVSLQKIYFQAAWDIFGSIFENNYGCSTVKILCKLMVGDLPQQVMTELTHDTIVQIARGAVFSSAMAFWGPEKFSTIQLPISFFVSPYLKASYIHSDVCKEVIHAVHMLIVRYASTIDPLSWETVIELLGTATLVDDINFDRDLQQAIKEVMDIIEGKCHLKKFKGPIERYQELCESLSELVKNPLEEKELKKVTSTNGLTEITAVASVTSMNRMEFEQ
uniref:Tuberin N-terminal domain-containing protein n=1 Tax=Panagrolaimus sp. JU765 TaxID=591449 RepID=A0AC34QLA4_9BILA